LKLNKCRASKKGPRYTGVLQAIREAKRTDIKIVTGAGGAKDFYKAIQDNNDIKLATFTYSPLMVKKAVDEAVDIVKGKKVTTKDITLPAKQQGRKFCRCITTKKLMWY
jgi:ABC-type sugar transport system substrate-binding protein